MESQEAKQKFKLANDLYQAERYDEALEVLEELEVSFPVEKNVIFPIAKCLHKLGRTQDALGVCDRLEALFEDPRVQGLRKEILAEVKTAAPKKRVKRSVPVKPILALVIVAVLGFAAWKIVPGLLEKAGTDTPQTTIARKSPEELEAENSQQKRIDRAIRAHIESGIDNPFTHLYDTGSNAAESLTGKELAAKTGWSELSEGQETHTFAGDAVLMNNEIALVFRNGATGVELYSQTDGLPIQYATLTPMSGMTAGTLNSVAIHSIGQDQTGLNATFSGNGGNPITVGYTLMMGQVFTQVQSVEGATHLSIEAPCRFTILPDFFADDMVMDALDIDGNAIELPSENFLLHMLGNGEAILVNVWDDANQDISLSLAGEIEQGNRAVQSSRIAFGEDGSVWSGLIAAPGVWHMRDISLADKGYEIALNWVQPFPALWRVDWGRWDGFTDSWEMLTEQPSGEFKKHGLFEETEDSWTAQDWWGGGHPRMRIASGLGRYHYPCWVDIDGRGWLEPFADTDPRGNPREHDIDFYGPALIYPLNRVSNTPLDKFTVVDVMRSTLGVGPCAYILDVEGQSESFEGYPTCTIQDVFDDIYEKGQQIEKQYQIEQGLDDVVAFIALIRNRIEEYVKFADDMDAYLDDQEQQNPELASFVESMRRFTDDIRTNYAQREESIKSVKYAKSLADEFRDNLLGNTGSDALAKCQETTSAWVEIGGNQDTLVAECRMSVKLMRQQAALALTKNPDLAEIAGEVRNKTQAILRDPVNYEAARH